MGSGPRRRSSYILASAGPPGWASQAPTPGHEAAERGAQDVSFLHAEVVEKSYHLGGQIYYAAGEVMLATDVEGDGAEVAREGGVCLNQQQRPKPSPPIRSRGGHPERRSLCWCRG